MLIFLIVLAAIAAGLTLFALLKGLVSFSQNQTTDSRNMQTQMMFARVKWQAITVLLIVVAAAVIAN
jgi:hypothetical protein